MDTSDDSAEGSGDGGQRDAPQARPPAAGDASPPLLIGGERYTTEDPITGEKCLVIPVNGFKECRLVPLPDLAAHPYAAITDWLNFTFPTSVFDGQVDRAMLAVLEILGPQFMPAVEFKTGRHKYERAFALGETSGFFAIGGNRDTAMVSLSGGCCALIGDWAQLAEQAQHRLKARVTLWHGAVDDFLGVHSVDWAADLYMKGQFNSGGRDPTFRQAGNWLRPDGSGRTAYIGKLENGKMLRVYEKGMEQGAKFHPWVRWELVYGRRGRDLPWTVVTEPGRFVAGGYPKALAWVRDEMCRLPSLQKQAMINRDAAVFHASNQVGPLVHYLKVEEGLSSDEIVECLEREGIPRRLRIPGLDNIGDVLK